MAQIVDHHDLIATFQPGDLPASERIVRVYQNEILRTAFLLTGTADGAVMLARDTFLAYFRQLIRGNVPDDPRYGLLLQLRLSLEVVPDDAESNGARTAQSLEGTVSFDAGQQRYRVEDQRSRVLSLLGLLDHRARIGLILRDFNALDEEPVCQIIDEIPFSLRQRLHPARERVQSAAGVDASYSVRELLVNAATAAPRPNLWPEIVGPLEELYSEEDERRQRLTYLAAGVVSLLLIFAGLWLFDLLPFGDSSDGAAAIAAIPTPTATATATPEPTVTATLIPDLSSFAIPQGDVPGTLYMRVSDRPDAVGETAYGIFHPFSQTFTPYDSAGFSVPSPDGRLLIGFAPDENSPADGTSRLVAVDSATDQRVWTSDGLRNVYSYVVTQDRIYLAVRVTAIVDGVSMEQPELREYDLETGELLREWPNAISTLQRESTSFFRIVLFASPAGDRLFVAVDEYGSVASLISARSLTSYSLPDMTLESANFQSDSTASGQFPPDFSFFDAYVTPDGEFLFRLDPGTGDLQFRSSDPGEDLDLALPFVQEGSGEEDLYWITSNDGRYLYVVALSRAEVVIVDLLARRVARGFPLDISDSQMVHEEVFRDQQSIGSGFGVGLALSLDGRNLYVLGVQQLAVENGGSLEDVEQSYLWTIDVETWTVTGFRELRGAALNVSEIDGSLVIMVYDGTTTAGLASKVLVLDPDSDSGIEIFEGQDLPEWTQSFFTYALHELYRLEYGRAPAVDHRAVSDVATESTLPRLTFVPRGREIPAGSQFDFAVRALNPADGQLFAEPDPAIRFDLDSTVIVRLSHANEEAEPVILVGNRREPGLYLASTALRVAGYWDAEVTVTGVDGESWSRSFERAFQIVPSWEASDGNTYFLKVATDPAPAMDDRPVAVTVRFVNVDGGAPLTAGVEILASFPDEIRISFDSGGDGVANETLVRNEDGFYDGEETLWDPGEWKATVEIRFADGELAQVAVGSVTVEPQ